MSYVFSGLMVVLSFSLAFADDPVNGCRVKEDSFKLNASILNNAGCIITRSGKDGREFLMVNVDKANNDKGWGFAGGKPSNSKTDGKLNEDGTPKSPTTYAFTKSVNFNYVEPAVCTASREAREELGFEVIVGDLIVNQPKFAAFHCYPTDPSALEKAIVAEDKQEIKGIGWFTAAQAREEGFMRFAENLEILDLVEAN